MKTLTTDVFFVEGDDDERFCREVILPHFDKHKPEIRPYANLSKEEVIHAIQYVNLLNFDYVFMGDIDNEPCVTSKKESIIKEYVIKRNDFRIDSSKIVVAIKEIESWYLAGLDNTQCEELGITLSEHTNDVTKEIFNDTFRHLISRNGELDNEKRRILLEDILRSFDEKMAKLKNDSFAYFLRKFVVK